MVVFIIFQVVLTFTSESNKTILRWTDPDISAQQQYNASYKLCDNNIHTIRVQRQQSTVKITIDNHKEESFTIQDGFQLDGDLYIGGVPGKQQSICLFIYFCFDSTFQ